MIHPRVIHIVVAYENAEELRRLFNAIKDNTNNQHKIVCVDNSIYNSDAIRNVVDEYREQKLLPVVFLKTLKNLGSAGGFAVGMSVAFELGAEWMWLHDQDGYPRPGCYETLLPFLCKSNYKILSPKIVDNNGMYVKALHGFYDKSWNLKDLVLDKEIVPCDVAASAGLLVHRDVVLSIGVYDTIHYFCGYEDFDYCLRAISAGFAVGVVTAADYFHPDKWRNIERRSGIVAGLKYYGHIFSNDNIKSLRYAHIYYHVKHNKKHPLLSLIYSIVVILYKRIIKGENIDIPATIKTFIKAIYYRYRSGKMCRFTDITLYTTG